MRVAAFDELTAGLGPERLSPATGSITEITDDSRRVGPGCLFVARGTAPDGPWRGWVTAACAAGAAAVVAPGTIEVPAGVGLAVAPVVDQPLAGRIAARFFGDPARGLKLVGVTGTNGIKR